MAAFVCRKLSVAYGGRDALCGVNFELPLGAFLAIVGENGSGKSTLVKALLGLVKPSGGEVMLSGGISRKDIGYMPQQRETRGDFPATVYEIVLSGRLAHIGLRPFYSGRDHSEAEKNLRRLGIWELRTKAYRELSGGQQQRTLLARSLCAARAALLLDEPFASLDAETDRRLYSTLSSINREEGTTVVMVTHDREHAASCATHILELNDGRQLYFGPGRPWFQDREGDKNV